MNIKFCDLLYRFDYESFICTAKNPPKKLNENDSNDGTKKSDIKLDKHKQYDVNCSYMLSFAKFYIILAVWGRYLLDAYVTYIRQFSYMNKISSVPDELKPYFSEAAFEEVKIHFMFKTLLSLEASYRLAIQLTVIYLTNIYCTLWWIANKISTGFFSRIIIFQMMQTICSYSPGDAIQHIMHISSAYSVGQGACRVCSWVRDILRKCWSSIATVTFVEDLILAVFITLMTTRMCVALYLLYRVYKSYLLPHYLENWMMHSVKLEEGELLTMINTLCEKFNFQLEGIYVSLALNYKRHSAVIRGDGDSKVLILGLKLVDTQLQDTTKIPESFLNMNRGNYNMGEIAAVILRAKHEYYYTVPTHQIIIESTHWVTTLLFALGITFGFFGGSRMGFEPSPPHTIALTMAKHVSIPLITLAHLARNYVSRKRNRTLDDLVVQDGFGEELIEYVGKEARNTLRCPIEDCVYTTIYSSQSSPINRIRHLRRKLDNADQHR